MRLRLEGTTTADGAPLHAAYALDLNGSLTLTVRGSLPPAAVRNLTRAARPPRRLFLAHLESVRPTRPRPLAL